MAAANMNNKQLVIWLRAARPRTLLLAISSVSMGLFLAVGINSPFRPGTAILTLITAILLQILSNLANDYGDFVHGADHDKRRGPSRAVQSGEISAESMKKAIYLVVLLTIIFGTILVLGAIGLKGSAGIIVFLLVGAFAIWSAVSYTAGNLPYGYAGFGDLAVFLFFGPVGVLGSYALQNLVLAPSLLLPATSIGLFSVAVLNINNIRDIVSDRQAGKNTIPVRLGLERARIYHWLLLLIGFLLTLLFIALDLSSFWQLLFVITLPLLVRNGWAISQKPTAALNPYLGQMSLTTFLFVITFGVGTILALD